jgi:hypothetical protein
MIQSYEILVILYKITKDNQIKLIILKKIYV